MISHKQVTSIKDDYNTYSKSIYSDSYFTGDNSSWKYLQMGGLENHIDISSQQSANKVDNRGASLSETLGLYYIAKALRTPGGIDSAVAHSLAKYFISKSSLKNLDEKLINSIINVFTTNDNAFDIKSNALLSDGKNYAINYIFDSSNNLIEIYYNKWNNINKIDINGEIINQKWTGDTWTKYSDDVLNFKLLNWSKYAKSWNEFITIYPKFEFNKDAFIGLKYDEDDSVDTNNIDNSFQTSLITNNFQEIDKAEVIDNNYNPDDDEQSPQWDCNLSLQIWHDNNNINCKFYINADLNDDNDVSTKIKEVNFYSI